MTDRPDHGCTINGQPAMPIPVDEYNQLVTELTVLRAALARIQAVADEHPAGIDTALIHEALDQTSPAATRATDHGVDRQTAVVLAALHRSAEADVSRVITLYERWVKAGPPPLGTSISRWWDKRLAELNAVLNEEQPGPA